MPEERPTCGICGKTAENIWSTHYVMGVLGLPNCTCGHEHESNECYDCKCATFDPINEIPVEEFDRMARMDGTYSPQSNRFVCDEDYIRLGQPSFHGHNWTATQENLAAALGIGIET